MASFLAEERQSAAAKAAIAHDITILTLIQQLACHRKRLEKVDGKTKVFIDEIAAEMEEMMTCMHDLMQWIILALPPTDSGDESSLVAKATALKIMDMIEGRSLEKLNMMPAYHVDRDAVMEEIRKEPQSDELLQDLESFDAKVVWEWKTVADEMIADCESLTSFIDKHRQFLESTETHVNDSRNLYR